MVTYFVVQSFEQGHKGMLIPDSPREARSAEQALAVALRLAAEKAGVVAFARTGNPSHPGLPPWPAYEPERRNTLVFAVPSSLQADPLGAERSAWGDVPFDGITPLIEELPL